MRLDSSALTTLNVFPLDKTKDSNSRFPHFVSPIFSLFGLLNHTLTAGMGERLLRRWLCQPLVSVDRINARLDLVSLFFDAVSLRNELRTGCLKGLVDVEKLAQRLERRVRFRLQDLYVLSLAVSKLDRLLVPLSTEFELELPAGERSGVAPRSADRVHRSVPRFGGVV